MPPPDVDKTERRQIEARGFKDFLEQPDESGLMWIKSKNDGSCHFLGKDNKCKIYDIRPSACKLLPYNLVDYDYEQSVVELDLCFPFSECCVGISKGSHVEQRDIEAATGALLKRILDLTAQDMELPVSDKHVHAEVRSRLLRRMVELADLNCEV